MKVCSKCKIEKPLDAFYRKDSSKDGRQGICKVCQEEYKRKWRQKNKEKIAEYHQKYYQEHKTDIVKYHRKYRQEHRAERAEYQRKWRQEHRARWAEYHRRWRHGHKAQVREYVQKWRQNNPEKVRAHNAVNCAIQAEELKPSVFCEECGLPAETQAHHEDYNKPLEVDWLCRSCHRQRHKQFI
ncbi:MAG: hypothetical protein JRI56_00180 [Deltaproteobacteria bacterium]|nr:hypothetical protein [Deltaproteobacteria bacterium]